MSAATPLPTGPDFACLASRSALDGTAAHTRLSRFKDGGLQYVDLDRGNRPEDAQVVGLRTLYGAVKTDRERSRVRLELLRQLSGLKSSLKKQAQSIVFGGGPVSYPPRTVSSATPAPVTPPYAVPSSRFRRMKSYIDAAISSGYFDDKSKNEAAVKRFLAGSPNDFVRPSQLKREGYIPEGVGLKTRGVQQQNGNYAGGFYMVDEAANPRTFSIHLPPDKKGRVSRSMAAHEGGHHRMTMQRLRDGTFDANTSIVEQNRRLRTPAYEKLTLEQATDPAFNPLIGDEAAAWDHATGRYDKGYRDRAMETYRTAADAMYRTQAGWELGDSVGKETEYRHPSRYQNVRHERGRLPDDAHLPSIPGVNVRPATIDAYLKTHTLEDTMNRVRDYYGRDAREQFNYRPGGTR